MPKFWFQSNTDNLPAENIQYTTPGIYPENTKTPLQAPKPFTRLSFGNAVIRAMANMYDDNEFLQIFGKPRQEISDIIQYAESANDETGNTILEEANNMLIATDIKIKELALENRINEAYNMLLNMASFSDEDKLYINAVEGENASSELPKYIKHRFQNIEEINTLISFVDATQAAHAAVNMETAGFTVYTAETLANEFENFLPDLTRENQAKMYFLSSRLYRKANFTPGCFNEPAADINEINCLRKALDRTSDLKIIACCRTSRFKKEVFGDKAFISAYKRALAQEGSPLRRSKINSQIAALYAERISDKKIGFIPYNAQDISNLKKAEIYLYNAAQEADNDNKLGLLKSLEKVQKKIGNKPNIAKTKEAIAYCPQFTPADRCQALVSIAVYMQNEEGLPYLHKALKEIKKAKITKNEKVMLLEYAQTRLPEISKNPQIISSVEASIANYKITPNKQQVRGHGGRD